MSQVIILLVDTDRLGRPIVAVAGSRERKGSLKVTTTDSLGEARKFDDIDDARDFLIDIDLESGLAGWRTFFVPADGGSAVPIEEGASL